MADKGMRRAAMKPNVRLPDDTPSLHPGLPKPVRRYWQGKAPGWVQEGGEESEDDKVKLKAEEEEEEEEAVVPSVAAPLIVKQTQDPRLARLMQREAPDREEAAARHREIAAAQVVSRRAEEREGESEEEEDEEALEARRAAVRERLKKRLEEEEEVVAPLEEEEEEEEEESEYETDSEDEGPGRTLLKPIFVRKEERETIAEREALEKEEEEALKRENLRAEERKVETREIVKTTIELEAAAARAAREGLKELGDIDTDDEKDEEAEYELWKGREMRRIRREREERGKEAREAAERDLLKTMTPAQRVLWEREHPKQVDELPKKKWKFMQKYWHKGAFFQTEGDGALNAAGGEEIFSRDFSAPTGEDKMDKSILPRVMQVKNFGRRGRTKWTHLVDQDTTEWDNPLAPERALQAKREGKMAGVASVFDKPKGLKT